MGNSSDGLGVAEARDEASIYDREDRPLGLHRGVRGLIEDTSHLAVAFRAAVNVVLAELSSTPYPRRKMLG